MKSYGRAPTFLAMTGYEQVRSVAAALAGDHEAADRVELTLPETGVCGGAGLFDDPDGAAGRRRRLLRAAPGDFADRRSRATGAGCRRQLPQAAAALVTDQHPTRDRDRNRGPVAAPRRAARPVRHTDHQLGQSSTTPSLS